MEDHDAIGQTGSVICRGSTAKSAENSEIEPSRSPQAEEARGPLILVSNEEDGDFESMPGLETVSEMELLGLVDPLPADSVARLQLNVVVMRQTITQFLLFVFFSQARSDGIAQADEGSSD
ncbi:hypothetical protein Salat_1110800 [Sesamum alatum]|uniref:Uncharacterized protein n=1 Tax=Sesamum alatum TaxID=300844 RepID=A0AAE1YN42_9LAMI|nr:hypothetical protein Salat_1110800 [Sesamum alatum]